MTRIYLFLIFTLLLSFQSKGQFSKQLEYGIGYFGNTFINPGIEFSVEYPVIDTRKTNKSYSDLGESIITVQGSAISYWDPFSHVGLLNTYHLNVKQYFGKWFGVQMGAGLVLQSNITGENYVVSDNFEVEQQGLKFNNYSGLHFSGGFFVDNKDGSRSVLNKLSLYVLSPYNAAVLPVFNYHLIYILK